MAAICSMVAVSPELGAEEWAIHGYEGFGPIWLGETEDLTRVASCARNIAVAEHHAVLLAHVRQSGDKRGAHDLLLAATARATGRTILTTDERARFAELPGVAARVVPTAR